jgi:hypothetical protein
MKVWILSAGSLYEGSCVISVHGTLEGGQSALNVELLRHAIELKGYREEDAFWRKECYDMREVSPGAWQNKNDVIFLKEWDVT